ncbi:hypothetical protein Tco_1041087 [Tanacetum coccineum]|uniref:Uncharacterized protein n=1 Tax=Tanacetum coccineum TaxID=301880 RepID=A0ABQ5GHM4_9ASTR
MLEYFSSNSKEHKQIIVRNPPFCVSQTSHSNSPDKILKNYLRISCFFKVQLTNLSLRNCIPPEVLLRVSMHPAWSASEKAVSSKPEPFGY